MCVFSRLVVSHFLQPCGVYVALQAPLSLGFPRQEYWRSPGDLPNPGIKPTSPALAGGVFTTAPPGRPYA